ncbi:MAG: hypothetical protein KZQ83_06940 [gamma proteobacterium symbiont of Taylorina sp.]|nr:hypothetical protein [gamma proteobacterium symbiont of Taylorina sp.]
MSSKKQILVRVDAGKVWGISMGHARRIILLTEKLRNQYDIVFIMKDYKDGIDYIKSYNYPIEVIDIHDDSSDSLILLCKKNNPKCIIFDMFSINYDSLFQYTRKNKIQTIIFDILSKCSVEPDMLFNDSFVPEFVNYQQIEHETQKFIGPEYFVMPDAVKPKVLKPEVQHIVLSMGGSDPACLTEKIAKVICLPNNIQLSIILGPSFEFHDKILDIIKHKDNIDIVVNPDNFIEYISHKDIIITSAGRTLYECAFLGLPSIIVPSITHEETTARVFAEITGSVNLGIWHENSAELLNKAIEDYCENFKYRSIMSKRGRKVVDGNGLQRVYNLINGFIE